MTIRERILSIMLLMLIAFSSCLVYYSQLVICCDPSHHTTHHDCCHCAEHTDDCDIHKYAFDHDCINDSLDILEYIVTAPNSTSHSNFIYLSATVYGSLSDIYIVSPQPYYWRDDDLRGRFIISQFQLRAPPALV